MTLPRDSRFQGAAVVAAFLFFLGLAAHAFAGGTAPAPYNSSQSNLATSNGVGGIGRTEGWSFKLCQSTSPAAVDVFANAQLPAALRAEIQDPAVTTVTRFVTVSRAVDYGAGTVANEALCVRVGPATDGLALTCPATDSVAAVGDGGGYLTAAGQSLQVTMRPILQCTDFASCHVPVWVLSSGDCTRVSVSIAW